MNYLLDTNAWLRLFLRPGEIRASVRHRLNAEDTLALSPFSLVEVAQKHASRKANLNLRVDLEKWFELALPKTRIRLLPITPAIAAKSYEFGPDFHGDPADRVITATAIVEGLTLVTADKKLIRFPGVDTQSTR